MRYRSKTTGRYVSEDFAREHPDESYAVNRRGPLPVVAVAVGAVVVLAVSAGLILRARR